MSLVVVAEAFAGVAADVAGIGSAVRSANGLAALWPGVSGTETLSIDQLVLGVINAPTQLLLGRPPIGNGTNGVAGQVGRHHHATQGKGSREGSQLRLAMRRKQSGWMGACRWRRRRLETQQPAG